MITFGPAQRYWLYRQPTDMRKSFDGLCGLVSAGLGRSPLSGDVFVFINRRRTHIKLLVWDRSGFVLYYKRLEKGTFELPAAVTETATASPTASATASATASDALSWQQLVLMLEGVALESARYRRRYALPPGAEHAK